MYQGLSPKDALTLWYQNRQRYAEKQRTGQQLTPEEQYDLEGNYTLLAKENPAAWKAVGSGLNGQGDVAPYKGGSTVSVFNPNTGQWTDKREKKWIEDPMSKAILAMAGGLGGVVAGPAMAGWLAHAGAPEFSVASTATGMNGAPLGVTAAGVPAATSGGAAAAAGGAMGWDNIIKLIGLGTGFLGGTLQGNANQQMSQEELLARLLTNQQSREDAQRAAMASFLNGDLDRQQSQANTGLTATQMDPYKHAKDLNSANVRRSFVEQTGGNPGNRQQGALDMSALSPDNLQRTGDYFYSNAAAASPNVPIGGMSQNAEQFRQTYSASQARLKEMIQKFLMQIGSPVQNPPTLPRV